MTHARYKELVCLSAYGELGRDDQRLLDAHLAGCGECRNELIGMQRIVSAIDETSFDEPEELLNEARAELHAALVRTRSAKTSRTGILDVIAGAFVPRWRIAFGGLAATVFGLFLGYLLFSPGGRLLHTDVASGPAAAGSVRDADAEGRAENAATSVAAASAAAPSAGPENSFAANGASASGADAVFEEGGTRAVNIRIVRADAGTGEIEFLFDAISPVHVRGNVNDEHVRKILVRTLKDEENVGVRLRAVSMIMTTTEESPRIDTRMKAALIAAAKKDGNAAVRNAVLDVLRLYVKDPDVQRALAYVLLNDKNSGVRVTAINILASARLDGCVLDKGVRDILKRKIQFDENQFIRNQSRNVLQEETHL